MRRGDVSGACYVLLLLNLRQLLLERCLISDNLYIAILMIVPADFRQQYIGCYRDGGPRDRVMKGRRRLETSLTVERCQQFCQQSTYMYFGLEVQLYVRPKQLLGKSTYTYSIGLETNNPWSTNRTTFLIILVFLGRFVLDLSVNICQTHHVTLQP